MSRDGQETDAGHVVEMLWKHPALALTLGYLLVSLLGLSFEWTLFRRFDVNFFYFAEVTDFLMGAFREPVTFLLSATALAVGWLAHLFGRWERSLLAGKGEDVGRLVRAYRRYAMSRFSRFAPVFFFFGYSVLFIWVHTGDRAVELREGRGAVVTVRQADSPRPERLQLLGTSSQFVFLFDAESGETRILPFENIASIHVQGSLRESD